MTLPGKHCVSVYLMAWGPHQNAGSNKSSLFGLARWVFLAQKCRTVRGCAVWNSVKVNEKKQNHNFWNFFEMKPQYSPHLLHQQSTNPPTLTRVVLVIRKLLFYPLVDLLQGQLSVLFAANCHLDEVHVGERRSFFTATLTADLEFRGYEDG